MSLPENQQYHFYIQGNNRGRIFFSRENYLYFLAKFSSFSDYVGLRNGLLCHQQAATDLLDISTETLYQESYQAVPPGVAKKLY
ncbi:hypothetical protein [Pleomorphovibrio marinus]|uniref:hypothetical protein n=1 Tax=Pleomorphovibrio marinus TaxID=2164132 RepID=UPI000E0BCB19|nr:hypothetical protein [Pleomorphovibrio marinus]